MFGKRDKISLKNKDKPELIGKGYFSKFYKVGDSYYLKTSDTLKESYDLESFWNYGKKKKHFPNLIEVINDKDPIGYIRGTKTYKTQFYKNISKTEYPDAYDQMRKMVSIWKKILID